MGRMRTGKSRRLEMKDWIVNAVFGVVCTLAWFAMWEFIHYLLTEV